MIIRPASSHDHQIWARMLAQRHAPHGSQKEFLLEIGEWLELPEPMHCWLAFDDDGEAVGFVDARVRSFAEGAPHGNTPYIEDIWVDTHHRQGGVARRLVAAVEDWVRAEGYDWLGSDAALVNKAAHGFHGALGFEEVERLVVFGKPL